MTTELEVVIAGVKYAEVGLMDVTSGLKSVLAVLKHFRQE